jgi:hypothetical protein
VKHLTPTPPAWRDKFLHRERGEELAPPKRWERLPITTYNPPASRRVIIDIATA